MKVEPYLIASTVSVAVGQRLVRRICVGCKEPRVLSETEKTSLLEMMPPELITDWMQFSKGMGCELCNGTGYRGRAGIYEVMEIGSRVRDGILRKAPASELRAIAIIEGMTPLVIDGFKKALAGVTTLEEIMRMRYE